MQERIMHDSILDSGRLKRNFRAGSLSRQLTIVIVVTHFPSSKCLNRTGMSTPLLTLRLFSKMAYSRIRFSSVLVVALAYVVL
jgi:hypothetical protein